MKAIIQRVSRAKVTVDGKITTASAGPAGEIGKGILILLGVTHSDTEKDVGYLVDKISNLRIFPSEKSEFDQSVLEVNGSLLVVSQFTLYGSTKKGRRPDFIEAAKPEQAEEMYNLFVEKARAIGLTVETGQFRAMMEVELVNDGPVTLMVESR